METRSTCVRLCGTCHHWLGPRGTTQNRLRATIDKMADEGRCVVSPVKTWTYRADHYCDKWKPWGALD